MTPEDRILSVLPLSFGYGLSQLLTCVRARATLVLELGLTFPGRVVRLLEDEKVDRLPRRAHGLRDADRAARASPSASCRTCAS